MFFLFVTAVISLLVTTLAIYLLCKHKKLRMLVASLALQQVKEVGTVTMQEEVTTECRIQNYIIWALTVTIFGLVMFAVLHSRKLKLCRGWMFSNAMKIMIFILDVQYYVLIKLFKTAGSIHLFKITGTIKPENVKLNWNYIWDTTEIDWKEVNMTFNSSKINLLKFVMIKFRDKFKIRCMMNSKPLLFHIMLKWRFTWFTLASNTQETVKLNQILFQNGFQYQRPVQIWLPQLLLCPPRGHNRCGDDHPDGGWHPYLQKGQDNPGDFI